MKALAICGALVIAVMSVEGVIRMSVPLNDVPALAWDADAQLLIHQPHQTGVRYPDRDITKPVRYTINAQGWNAPADYPERDYRSHLAIVIGDSFVEALQVAPNESVWARLQILLGGSTWGPVQTADGPKLAIFPPKWRVYGMGMSGAPLSQYLQMARAAERRYHPDLIIIVLVHNDFIESYESPDNALYDSFWHTNGVKMIGPKVYRRSLASWFLGESSLLRLTANTLRQSAPATTNWQMGVDVEKNRAQMATTARVTDYLFEQFALLKPTTSLLFAMDADRTTIEGDKDPRASPVYPLNQMVGRLAAAHGLRLLDLTPVFTAAWEDIKTRNGVHHRFNFDWATDYHWNAYAHDLVARTLLPYVVQQ